MSEAVALPREHTKFSDLLILTKVRLNALVVFTTAGGYWLGSSSGVDPIQLLLACVGTALVASGAAAMNQVSEREIDRLMHRTRRRPIPGGRMGVAEGSAIGIGLALAGFALLALTAGWLPTLVAAVTLVSYVLVYTPLKRHTSLATVVGAVPGALPPVIGWAAARGSIASPEPWALFLIMFIWQLPHFLAIAWMFREDYARAGLPMLPVVDKHGALTGRQAVLWAATVIPMSELPFLLGLSNRVYAMGALVIGVLQLVVAVRFALDRSREHARGLFLATITYLPLLWLLMAFGR
ncbi:MAG: heme o synthase [Vicinamibacterales bacterium]